MSVESTAVEGYIYHPLDSKNQEIRLITIKAGCGPEPIKCCLTHVSLDDKPQYEAFSYVWGDQNDRSNILLEGYNFSVTSNLGTALYYIRLPEADRTMWIDAICIDQKNLTERESQVQIMRIIYQEAEKVVSWMGALESEYVATQTASFLREAWDHDFSIAWLRSALASDPGYAGRIGHVRVLCGRDFPYWNRIWITQEVALARRGVVKWKEVEIPYEWFVSFYNTFGQLLEDCKWMYEHVGAGSSLFLIDLWGDLKRNDMIQRTSPGTPLLDLLRNNRYKNATDPRDKIYALLGLSDMAPNSHEGLMVNYSEGWSKRDVYTGVVRAVVENTSLLDILCEARPGADVLDHESSPNDQKTKLPSWAPDWAAALINTWPHTARKWKGASGIKLANAFFYDDKNLMKAQGICVGTVGSCGRCLPNPRVTDDHKNARLVGEICHGWTEIWKSFAGDSADLPDAFCRAILLGYAASPEYKDLLLTSINQCLLPSSSIPSEAVILLSDIQRTIQNFRFFTIDPIDNCSLRNGDATLLCGIGPEQLQEKDKICVLLGCRSPVAIRPDGDRYRFVGPVFVHSLMDGQAMQDVEMGHYSMDWFEMY